MQPTIVLLTFVLNTAFPWEIWNSTCYHFSLDILTYSSAQDSCKALYSYLVEVETKEEHDALVTFVMFGIQYWTGAQKNNSNHYYWLHGGGPILSSLWASYAPNDNAVCARFRGDTLELDDQVCTFIYNYICEKKQDENAFYICEVNRLKIENIAIGRPTAMSSIYNSSMIPGSAIDGITGSSSHCSSTGVGKEVWWQIDLEGHAVVDHVVITNRADCCEDYLKDLDIRIYSVNPVMYSSYATYSVCGYYTGPATAGETTIDVKCSDYAVGRWLRITKTSILDTIDSTLTLCEVEIYAVYCSKTYRNPTCGLPSIQYEITAATTTVTSSTIVTSSTTTTANTNEIWSKYFQHTPVITSNAESTTPASDQLTSRAVAASTSTSDEFTTQVKATIASKSDEITTQMDGTTSSTSDEFTTHVKATSSTFDEITTQMDVTTSSTSDEFTTQVKSTSSTSDELTTQIKSTSSTSDEITTQMDVTTSSTSDELTTQIKSTSSTSDEFTTQMDGTTSSTSDELTTQIKSTSSTSDEFTTQMDVTTSSTSDELTTQMKSTSSTSDEFTTQMDVTTSSTSDELTTQIKSTSSTSDEITTQIKATSSTSDEFTILVKSTSSSSSSLISEEPTTLVKTISSDEPTTQSITLMSAYDVFTGESTTMTSENPTTLTNTKTAIISEKTTLTQSCKCPCERRNLTEREILDIIQKIQSELSIHKKSTNAYQRSLVSAHDSRPSARGIGGTGLVIILIVFLLFVISDLSTLISFLYEYITKRRRHRNLTT